MKSRFVSGVGWFAILGGVLGSFSGAFQLLGLRAIRQDPEMGDAMLAAIRDQMGADWTMEVLQQSLLRNGSTTLTSSILGVVLGWALLKRKPWARVGTIWAIVILTLGMIVSAVTGSASTHPIVYWTSIALSVLAVFIHGGIVIQLRKPEIQAEFKKS